MFDVVGNIANFLEKKYNMENLKAKKMIKFRLSDITKEFEGKDMTVLNLFNITAKLHSPAPLPYGMERVREGYFKTQLENISENLKPMESVKIEDVNYFNKPLGLLGDITINEAINNTQQGRKRQKWDVILNNFKVGINVLPLACAVIGYGLIMRTYVKHVYNKPIPQGMNLEMTNAHKLLRNQHLTVFAFLGAPLIGILLKKGVGLGLNNVFEIEILNPKNNTGQLETKTTENGIFLVFSYIIKKIPKWLKWARFALVLIIIGLLIANTLGLTVLKGFYFLYYIKNYIKIIFIVLYIFVIIFNILNIYFLSKFKNNSLKISEVLPEFIINWLKSIQIMSSSKESIKEFKNSCYLHISIYLFLIFIVIIL